MSEENKDYKWDESHFTVGYGAYTLSKTIDQKTKTAVSEIKSIDISELFYKIFGGVITNTREKTTFLM